MFKNDLVRYARSLGFERVGITPATPLNKEGAALSEWLAQGCEGEMDYMAREPERRADPEKLLPGAKSVVALAMNYDVPSPLPSPAARGRGRSEASGEGKIAKYAYGRDYHKVIGKRLDSFVRYASSLEPGAQFRTFVDAGPLLERPYAQRAGLGFIGKNTMLITKGLGSWVFLAHVLTTLDLPADEPDLRSCGNCRLCLDACPTGAIDRPFHVDARRCISYLTIEMDGTIPEDLRRQMGEWVFGCDICQDVCPHNRVTTVPSPLPSPAYHGRGGKTDLSKKDLSPRPPQAGEGKGEGTALSVTTLAEILTLRTEEQFLQRFGGTSLTRAGRASLVRNACVVAGNLKRHDLIPALKDLAANDEDSVVREHAAWALMRIDGAHQGGAE